MIEEITVQDPPTHAGSTESAGQANAIIAGQAGDRLSKGLQEIIDRYKLPFVAYNHGSIVHLETSGVMLLDFKNPLKLMREVKPRKHMMEEFGLNLALKKEREYVFHFIEKEIY